MGTATSEKDISQDFPTWNTQIDTRQRVLSSPVKLLKRGIYY